MTLYAHIGFSRASSTLFQSDVISRFDMEVASPAFPDREMINFINKNIIMRGRNSLLDPLTDAEVLEFKEMRESDKTFISNEGLIGDAFDNMLPLMYNITLLKQLDSDLKLILFIRSQYKLLNSYYNYAVAEGFHKGIESFLNYENKKFGDFELLRNKGVNVSITSLNYLFLLKNLQKMVGRENILMLPVELLHDRPLDFIGRIEAFCGSKFDSDGFEIKVRNNGYNKIQIFILRMLNKIVDTKIFGISIFPKYNQRMVVPFLPKKLYIIERILNKILSRRTWVMPFSIFSAKSYSMRNILKQEVKESFKFYNDELSKELGFDLARYDY